MYFLGVMGICGGMPRAALDEPLNATDVSALSQAALHHLEAALNAGIAPKGRFRVTEPLSN